MNKNAEYKQKQKVLLIFCQALMEVFPAGKMVPRNLFQSEFMHFPRQQDAALQVLNAMSHQGI